MAFGALVGCSSSSDVATTDAATDAAGGTCSYGGHTYKAGETFPSTDGCNSCGCGSDGAVACTAMACLDGGPDVAADAGTCTYGGHTYSVGDKFPATDDCNTCTCGEGGAVACTKCACVPLDAGGDGGDASDAAETGPRCGS